MSEIWSNTDFPYMCLKDETRTWAFRDAIHAVVRPGDVVVDVGAGSGILSFFAAAAGAAQVHAVEIDPVSAAALRRSVELNPAVADRVRVVEGDAATVDLPLGADVVVAEIIETGLLDEQQVPVLNALRRRGVIDATTRLVPDGLRDHAAAGDGRPSLLRIRDRRAQARMAVLRVRTGLASDARSRPPATRSPVTGRLRCRRRRRARLGRDRRRRRPLRHGQRRSPGGPDRPVGRSHPRTEPCRQRRQDPPRQRVLRCVAREAPLALPHGRGARRARARLRAAPHAGLRPAPPGSASGSP